MNVQFDYFGQPEFPYIILCNPDLEEIASLGLCYDTKMKRKFNSLSEFSFVFPKSIDGNVTDIPAYDYLKNKRIVLVEGHGYFQIINAEENLDGLTPLMTVDCRSLESELIQKKITQYSSTTKLWDILDPEGTLLDYFISLAPNWSVGNISSSLLVKFRTFDISDSNVYNVLMVDVEKAFECVVVFETTTRTINIYDLEDATNQTDIFLSFDNLLDNAKFEEKSDEIVTALSVYGDGNLNIRQVNPLGSNTIYNFSYYKDSTWMSSLLTDAITNWENLVSALQATYAANLTLLSIYNSELLDLQSDLATLNSDLLALEGVKALRIQAGQSLVSINSEISAKQSEISSQEVLIENKQIQISDTTLVLQNINSQVSFENNFTSEQLLELNNFIYENSFLNNNIIQTDSMTLPEIQSQAQELYNQGISVLSRVSQPRYQFELESANYTLLEEFRLFTQQTELGIIATCELKDGSYVEAVLLEIEYSFDDPENFSLVFSNRLRLDGNDFTYSDLMGTVQETGASVSFDSAKWSDWENNYKDPVSTFITSSLDATINNLISNTNQEILINQNGLIGRSWDESLGAYKPKQVWLTNNVLAFSSDSFNTAKLALGEITLQSGGTAYGLVGEVIIGRLLAGNSLTITNETNNFLLDSTGATLNNAKFNIETTNTKIIIDPTGIISFRIQKNEGGTFNDKFWVDNTGNVNFSGNLAGATGTFSGSLSAATGTFSGALSGATGTFSGALVAATGTFSGNLSGASGTFSGDIYANRLIGAVSYSQLTDIPANKITSGSMSGDRLYGGTWSGSGMAIRLTGTGVPTITGTSGLLLEGGSTSLSMSGSLIVQSSTYIGGTLQVTSTLFLNGLLNVNGSYGLSTTRSVSTPSGSRTMTFSRGILIGFT